MTPLLELAGVTKHFPIRNALGRTRGAVRAVDGVTLHVMAGEVLAIVGESGCGKSTLGRVALRLIEPDSGSIRFEGEDFSGLAPRALRARRQDAQIIFQDPFGSLDPRMSVAAAIEEPLILHTTLDRAGRAARVADLLTRVGLRPEMAGRWPHEFSGGQRQRIAIARALASAPKLIIGDEPVSALDVSVQAQVLNLLMDLQEEFGLAYLFVSHDLGVVEHIGHRIAVMYLGRIAEIGPKDDVVTGPLHPYTKALISAAPVPDPRLKRERLVIEGDVPSPVNPPPGCRFHTRCPFAIPRCREEEPALREVAPGRHVACHLVAG